MPIIVKRIEADSAPSQRRAIGGTWLVEGLRGVVLTVATPGAAVQLDQALHKEKTLEQANS